MNPLVNDLVNTVKMGPATRALSRPEGADDALVGRVVKHPS
jgi:hypothetical protein